MKQFYKRWQFYLYLVICSSNLYEITIRNSFNIFNIRWWMSTIVFIIFTSWIFLEIKNYPIKKT